MLLDKQDSGVWQRGLVPEEFYVVSCDVIMSQLRAWSFKEAFLSCMWPRWNTVITGLYCFVAGFLKALLPVVLLSKLCECKKLCQNITMFTIVCFVYNSFPFKKQALVIKEQQVACA